MIAIAYFDNKDHQKKSDIRVSRENNAKFAICMEMLNGNYGKCKETEKEGRGRKRVTAKDQEKSGSVRIL